ncbi:hypothetical protein [Arthrobacter sp. RT-1]|uniref:hypothetical protein n=1 Tax=Arthrobacter sp. RT-1 TaxID=2292263 RepID=UPI0011C083E9|nr:hypothetical protein [Arthrobacter sp. RT-1]
MASTKESTNQPTPPKSSDGVQRRRLLKSGTLVAALTGISTLSAVETDVAHAADNTNPLAGYIPTAEKGAASGVATLDPNSKIPPTQLPDLSSTILESISAALEDPDGILPAAFPAKAGSPRDASRVKLERKPILLVDRISPNTTWGDMTLLSVVSGSMYAVGADRTLRSSSDKGATWSRLAQGSGGKYGQDGMFFRTATAGTILATWHPDGGGAPTIRRSTNYGATFTDVVAAQLHVDYLGPTSICQDATTGYIYIAEYVHVSAALKPTWKIIRSTDNGASWSTFRTFQRDAALYPTTAVRHGHGVQWDQHGKRIFFLTGDAESASGIYRVNAAGTDVEPVLLRSSQTEVLYAATAVGIMFFPDYIAWGQDQTGDAWLLRMERTQIGQPSPRVEKIMHLQSCAWYTVRTKGDGTEWLMGVSNQHAADVAPVDNCIHLYRVADNGATCDEVAALPATSLTATNYFYPLDTPLQSNTDEYVWIGSNIYNPFESPATADPHIGQQLKVSLGWGAQSILRPDVLRRAYTGTPQTQNSSRVTLSAAGTYTFGATRVPNGARKLYVFDLGVCTVSGSGSVKTRVWNASTATAVVDAAAGAIETTAQSVLYNTANNESAPTVFVSNQLPAGSIIYFDLVEITGKATADAVGYVQFAWGY